MSRQDSPSYRISTTAVVLGTAVFVLVVGLATVFLLGGGSSGSNGTPQTSQNIQDSGSDSGTMPDYVMSASEDTRMAYQFAMDRPDMMMWMPCYCGCGGHSGHKSAKNCFIKESSTAGNVQFDEHGASCEMCVTIALDTKRMTAEGRSLKEMRTYIDDKFGDIGPGTDTPMPPG